MSASEYNNSEFRTPNSKLKKCAVSSVGRAVKIPSCIKTVTAILAFNTQAAGSIPARRTNINSEFGMRNSELKGISIADKTAIIYNLKVLHIFNYVSASEYNNSEFRTPNSELNKRRFFYAVDRS